MELEYTIKLLAKTVDEVDEKLTIANTKLDSNDEAISQARELLATIDRKLELLPLVLASKIEPLIEKRTGEAFEDIRVTLDELRNKLYAIKKDVRFVREGTGSHSLPSRDQLAQWDKDNKEREDEKEGLVKVTKGKFSMVLPMTEGTLRVVKYIAVILGILLGTGATAGGIWALVDRIKHAVGGG